MLRLSVRTIYLSVLTNSQKCSNFSPYSLSFCTNQFTKRFVFLFEQFFFLYQPNHKLVRLFVRKSFASVPNHKMLVFLCVKLFLLYQPNQKFIRFSVRKKLASVPTKSQNASTFCPYNLSFCTNQFTKRFDFLSVHFILLY